jgi:hypothetical protein
VKTTVVLVSGARVHPDPLAVTSYLADYVLNTAPGPVIVRHGDCPGPRSVDQAVANWVRDCGEWLGVTADPMPADWDHCTDNCPAAGPRRNAAMVTKTPRAVLLIAAPHGTSYGTRGCMKLAERAGIDVWQVTS